MSQETQKAVQGDDGGARPSVAADECRHSPPSLDGVGRGWLPGEDPLLVSTDPLSFVLHHEDTEYGGTCGLDPWAPKSGPLRNFTPSQPKSSSKLLPHAHCRTSGRLLMAIVTRSALSRQTLWLSLFWARLDSQAPGLTCSGRRNCTALSLAGQHTDTRTWGPGGLHRPHQPVL